MNNDELLIQISELLDKKLKPLHEEQRMTNERIDQTNDRIDWTNERIKRIELLLENEVTPRLQNIESCYTDTYGRYVVGVEQIEALQADVDILKRVVNEHSKKLNSK